MLAAIIAIFAIVADQISKYIVVQNIELYETVPFIDGFMSFYHTRNTGAAFSMLSEHRWVFMVFSFVSMGLIVYLLIKEYRRHILLNIALSMVLGGGIGNMIDRIRLGYVVDFFHTDFVNFAVFNIADCFITVGAILLGIYVIFFEAKVERRIQAEKAKQEAEKAEQEAVLASGEPQISENGLQEIENAPEGNSENE